MSAMNSCPACRSENMRVFYCVDKAPVHSVRLLRSRSEALQFPTGEIQLTHCMDCGFIWNRCYQPELQDYSAEYESTQAYSATFNSFARRLSEQIIDRFDLHEKTIIEIGCGQGEFLSLLCEIGRSRGIGFDPAYDPARSAISAIEDIQIIPDYYSEKYSDIHADFICCKMTLEHIQDVEKFIGTLRRSIGGYANTTVFFQVPYVNRVLEELAFWDIYYEHCSYFSPGSITRLFQAQGFDVRDVWRDYGDQYLMIDAKPSTSGSFANFANGNDLAEIGKRVETFQERCPEILSHWKRVVQDASNQGQKVVLWGSGSKGVAFLTTLGICDEIRYTVDINPVKHGTYMAGTGQMVVSPDSMSDYSPDLVILMNPMYREEVQKELTGLGLSPRILVVGEG